MQKFHLNLFRLVTLGSLVVPLLAPAQSTRGYVTLESRLGWSQSAYVGTIASVTHQDAASAYLRFELTVDVKEVLKGAKATSLKLGGNTVLPLRCLESYATNHTLFLWFVMPEWPGGAAFDSWVVPNQGNTASLVWDWRRLGPEVPEHNGFLSQEDGINLFSLDFQVLDTPAKILAAARSYAETHPGLQTSLHLDIPWPLAALCGLPSEVANRFYVPVVAELEGTAKSILTNARPLLSRGTGRPRWVQLERANAYDESNLAMLRPFGVEALAPFKSEDNIALLERYRIDPYFEMDLESIKRFPVRDAVKKVLEGWRVGTTNFEEQSSPTLKGTVAQQAQAAMLRRLQNLRLESVGFEKMTLDEVIVKLGVATKRQDPEHKGVNIIWCPHPEEERGLRSSLISAPVDPNDLEPSSFLVTVEPELVGRTLEEVLDAVVAGANAKIHYTITPHAIIFWPP